MSDIKKKFDPSDLEIVCYFLKKYGEVNHCYQFNEAEWKEDITQGDEEMQLRLVKFLRKWKEDMIRETSGRKENASSWILTLHDDDGWFVRGRDIPWQAVESVWASVETILRIYSACTIPDNITSKEFQDHLFAERNTLRNGIPG